MFHHRTVLLQEAVEALQIKENGIYVDGTLGGGGHSEAILSRLKNGLLIGIDQDDRAIAAAGERLHPGKNRLLLVRDNFVHMDAILNQQGIEKVDGFLFDLGVSSPQLDEEERGFRYQEEAPLDMRMDRRQSLTAYEVVNEWPEGELTRIIREYGEERFARSIARRIVERRKTAPIATTGELVEVIKEAIPAPARRTGPHPAKRTFQAIRIAVNRELEVLGKALHLAIERLKPGGRIAVISFHSLEDRIVKETFQEYAAGCTCPPDFPVCVCGKEPIVKIITRKPILPSEEEIETNPRARSAKLRVAEKVMETEKAGKSLNLTR
ncbi:16S rRNA (cytosine(1402)-N(4))-methyltransferase RsmH [Thermicanus aegyptius]|uniref:16S rRNA (cytosine(1402)-N(4))-methyltransferase RsmH n=1 Tax=Thermicanus aegyptius TaxID=94009 RepID=UPI000694A8D2|nr:16S rRNA (cytosine(1402)-N(4))-methyltransferase RsmH [Thermicanus aegyptius]